MFVSDSYNRKSRIPFFSSIILCLLCIGLVAIIPSAAQPPDQDTIVKEIQIDEIALKQREMQDTVVMVATDRGRGSGTIIDVSETDTEGTFEYRVLTNAHVTTSRFRTRLQDVDSLTGKIVINTVDTGCQIIIFDNPDSDWDECNAKVVVENVLYDIAILSFVYDRELYVANMANEDMLKRVRVFDEIFTIGCQLGTAPSPTFGIISQIITGSTGDKEWVVYMNTSHIAPGASGGGLFKKYDGHYYLIGVPFSVSMANNGQFITHMAHAISITTAREFIDQSLVTYP